jgi:hypothetical protein
MAATIRTVCADQRDGGVVTARWMSSRRGFTASHHPAYATRQPDHRPSTPM